MSKRSAPPVPAVPPLLYRVDAAARALGVGRSTLYAEIAAGRLRACHIGRRTLIHAADLEAFAQRVRLGELS